MLSGLLRWKKKGLDSLTAEKTSNEVAESLGLPEDTMSAFWGELVHYSVLSLGSSLFALCAHFYAQRK